MHPIFNWTIILCNQFHNSRSQHLPHIINPYIYLPTLSELQSDEGVGTRPNFFGFMEFGFRVYGICRDAKSDEGVV